MSGNQEVAELYRLIRRRKPAAAMLLHTIGALIALLAWASITPVAEVVSHRIKVVPTNGIEGNAGSLNPASPVGGMVSEVVVRESMWVEKGDLLLRFDSEELVLVRQGELKKQEGIHKELEVRRRQILLAQESFKAKLSELLAQKVTELDSYTRLEAERKINQDRAASELLRANSEYARGKKLLAGKAISKSELESLKAVLDSATGEVALARLPISKSKVEEIEKRIESHESSHAEAVHLIEAEQLLLQTKLEAVKNEIRLLDLKIENCSILAPRSGVVSQCQLRRGDWIPPGEIGIAISQQDFVAEAILPSRLICDVQKGSKARITLDGIDWLVYGSLTATVTEVAPDLQKVESVLGDGSTEVVDGYRVLLQFESDSEFKKWDSIRLGMTGSVEIDVGEKKLAIYLMEKAVGTNWLSKE